MHSAFDQLTLNFLAWLDGGPRTYAETMDAWRTSCPRLTVWEDAIREGLVQVGNGSTRSSAPVSLTMRGRALLDANSQPRDRA